MQPLHTRKIGGSNPSTATNSSWRCVIVLAVAAMALISAGEILECITFVNVYETWCDSSWLP